MNIPSSTCLAQSYPIIVLVLCKNDTFIVQQNIHPHPGFIFETSLKQYLYLILSMASLSMFFKAIVIADFGINIT